ncbi:MAG: hypothetical protein U0903_03365 [Planctomycetales bacterium]
MPAARGTGSEDPARNACAANAPQTSAPPAVNAPESPAENPSNARRSADGRGKTAPSEEEAPAQKPAEEPSAGVDNSGIPGPQFGFAPPASRTTTAGGKLNSAKPSIRTVSNSKTPDAGNGPNLARVVSPPAFSAPATESTREEPAASTAEDSEEETAEEETETESAKAAPMMTLNAGTGMMMFLGGMCVLCCAGMGWMFRDLRRLKSAATTTPETAVQTDSPIRQILYNELPLVEENVPTRHEWHYQGRPQHLKPQRFDAAHLDEQGHSRIPQPHANFQPVQQPVQQPFAGEFYPQEQYEQEQSIAPPLPPRYMEAAQSMRDGAGRTHRIDPQVNAEGAPAAEPHSRSRRVPATAQQRDLSSSGILERVLASVQGGKHARRS